MPKQFTDLKTASKVAAKAKASASRKTITQLLKDDLPTLYYVNEENEGFCPHCRKIPINNFLDWKIFCSQCGVRSVCRKCKLCIFGIFLGTSILRGTAHFINSRTFDSVVKQKGLDATESIVLFDASHPYHHPIYARYQAAIELR